MGTRVQFFPAPIKTAIRNLSNDDGDGNENVERAMTVMIKTTSSKQSSPKAGLRQYKLLS